MKTASLQNLIDQLINETISEEDHKQLEDCLKTDEEARSLFRERMDLEAALRTWASETPNSVIEQDNSSNKNSRWKRSVIWGSVLVAMSLLVAILLIPFFSQDSQPIARDDKPTAKSTIAYVGRLREQPGSQWETPPKSLNGRVAAGDYSLTQGVAELSLDSGTNLVLEAPCAVTVHSLDSAELLSGTVFVSVKELSGGFTLETSEGQIDEGTEYAVACDVEATEIHVFDGSVVWLPEAKRIEHEQRIRSGEARRFSRTEPFRGHHIPFGQRLFVRRIEFDLKKQAGSDLLAYDGFENLAGQIRRNRSGFGWAGGWLPATRRSPRKQLAAIVDAPDDEAFGMSRKGRRVLSLRQGDDIRREFSHPLSMASGETYYLSFLLERFPSDENTRRFLEISLDQTRRGHRRPQSVSCGITSEGFPFVRVGPLITETAARIQDREICFCIVKITLSEQTVHANMRVYRDGEELETIEPTVWTVTGTAPATVNQADAIRLTVGSQADWQVDELRLGKSWVSVTTRTEPQKSDSHESQSQ